MFLSDPFAGLGWMAEAMFNSLGEKGFTALAAFTSEGTINPVAIEVMKEIGFSLPARQPRALSDTEPQSLDLVITIGTAGTPAPLPDLLRVGDPVHIHWKVPVESDPGDSSIESVRRAARNVREEIRSRVVALVTQGYLQAIVLQRQRVEHLVDAIDDGLIVHDQCRHIYLFNRAAERITGYSREEVLGRNCHEIFAPDGICSSQCLFSTGTETPAKRDYELTFTTKQGEDKRLRMRVTPLPVHPDQPPWVLAILRDVTEVNELRWKMKEKYSFHGMAGRSQAMQEIFHTIRQVTTSDYPVLISGESGTGKELVARAIHNESRRKGGPFVPINCGALPETILESELFGHVRGAFTGAIRDKKGRFELAHTGTLFLDEVGELSAPFQVKLLRVLQEKRFEPVGGERSIAVDVRIIAATNRDLRLLVAEGKFREDLFYRLAVVPIQIPPLRERREDLPMLVDQILASIREESNRSLRLSDAAMASILSHSWPGNVRELINALQYASVRCQGDEILPEHLPPEVRAAQPVYRQVFGEGGKTKRFKLNVALVDRALQEAGGNRKKAARLLKVGRATLYRFLDRQKPS